MEGFNVTSKVIFVTLNRSFAESINVSHNKLFVTLKRVLNRSVGKLLSWGTMMEEPARSKRLIEIYRNRVKASIIHLLRIYRELSTLELANKLGKSKPTVLRNIEELVQLGIIRVNQIDNSPGKYPKQTYQLQEKDLMVKGQELRPYLHENPEFILSYTDFRIAYFTQLEGIVTSCIAYLGRMRKEYEKNINDPDELLEIAKDNLGAISLNYLTKEKAQQVFMEDDEQVKDSSDQNESKDYLHIQLLLPIKRLIEMEKQDTWVKDGTLWWYTEK